VYLHCPAGSYRNQLVFRVVMGLCMAYYGNIISFFADLKIIEEDVKRNLFELTDFTFLRTN